MNIALGVTPLTSCTRPAWLRELAWSAPAGTEGGSGDTGGGSASGAAPPRTFTQDEVNRMLAAEKDQGRRAGKKDVLEKLGVDSVDAAEAAVRAAAEARDANKTAEERARAAAEEDRRAAAEDRAAAQRERVTAHRLAALTRAKCASPEDGVKLLGDLAPDATDDETAAAIASLKERLPALFTAEETTGAGDPGRPPSPSGNGAPNPPPPGTAPRQWGAAGRAAAKARLPKTPAT